MRSVSLVAVVAILALPVTVQAFIVPVQVDDFQDGTFQGWTGGVLLTNIPNGGPAGAGDRYLEVTSNATTNGKIGTFNQVQWAGDYLSAGITAVQADVLNTSAFDLELRALLAFGPGGDFTSTLTQVIPNDGFWHNVTFGLTAADLTYVGGNPGNNLNDTLQNVGRLLIRHQPGAPAGAGGGVPATGSMGLDNILAIPEPATLVFLAIGGSVLLWRRNRSTRP